MTQEEGARPRVRLRVPRQGGEQEEQEADARAGRPRGDLGPLLARQPRRQELDVNRMQSGFVIRVTERTPFNAVITASASHMLLETIYHLCIVIP